MALKRPRMSSGDSDTRSGMQVAGGRPAGTFPSRLPLLRIDHIFVDEEIGVRRSFVHDSPLARRASDHLPLCADIEIEEHLENSGQLGNLSAPA